MCMLIVRVLPASQLYYYTGLFNPCPTLLTRPLLSSFSCLHFLPDKPSTSASWTMADTRNILILFDVDGTLTPSRLVSYGKQ